MGGRDVRSYDLQVLRDAVGMILQKNVLFSGTIREKPAVGGPGADEEALWNACRTACADEFIEQMPEGLDTDLGTRRQQSVRRTETEAVYRENSSEKTKGSDF